MTDHEKHRLTEADEEAMQRAMSAAWHDGETDSMRLTCVAAHAIGCTPADLRAVECQWIDNEIGELEMGL